MTVDRFLELAKLSGLLNDRQIRSLLATFRPKDLEGLTERQRLYRLIDVAVELRWLTAWQCDNLVQGSYKWFFIGNYKLLSQLSSSAGTFTYSAEKMDTNEIVEVAISREPDSWTATISIRGRVIEKISAKLPRSNPPAAIPSFQRSNPPAAVPPFQRLYAWFICYLSVFNLALVAAGASFASNGWPGPLKLGLCISIAAVSLVWNFSKYGRSLWLAPRLFRQTSLPALHLLGITSLILADVAFICWFFADFFE